MTTRSTDPNELQLSSAGWRLLNSARRPFAQTFAWTWKRVERANYIVTPAYDWLLFLLPPLLALGIGILISGTPFADDKFKFWGQNFTRSELVIGCLIHAHLIIVFFRSHGNREIFDQYPGRFLAVPVLLYAAIMSWEWVLITIAVVATFWDVYHSGLQTFGFARIYDLKQGNPPIMGRRLDLWMNHLLYAGPILAGATMLDHFRDFKRFERVEAIFFTSIPAFMEGNQHYFTWAVLGLGSVFTVWYLLAYWRFHKQGYQVSLPKVYLLASTGLCSIYTWGFNTWGQAFLIMNLFHAVQYFGLVWATEKGNIMDLFRTRQRRFGKPVTIGLFLGLPLLYGYWVQALDARITSLWAITITISIMHYWYDGFIWSVRKKQI